MDRMILSRVCLSLGWLCRAFIAFIVDITVVIDNTAARTSLASPLRSTRSYKQRELQDALLWSHADTRRAYKYQLNASDPSIDIIRNHDRDIIIIIVIDVIDIVTGRPTVDNIHYVYGQGCRVLL